MAEIVKQLLRQLDVGNYRSLRLTSSEVDDDIAHLSLLNKEFNADLAGLLGDREALTAAPLVVEDVLIVADVLKIWFRKMPEPITTFALYDMCITAATNNDHALAQVCEI